MCCVTIVCWLDWFMYKEERRAARMSTQKSSHMTRREEATPMIIIHDRLIFSIRNFPCPLHRPRVSLLMTPQKWLFGAFFVWKETTQVYVMFLRIFSASQNILMKFFLSSS